MPGSEPTYQLRKFTASYEALGIVMEFVVSKMPFARSAAGRLLPALKHQLAHGHHICAFRGDTLVGYCGWLPITEQVGERWLNRSGELVPAPPEVRDEAAALTIVRVEETPALYAMIEALRQQTRPRVRVFYRRAGMTAFFRCRPRESGDPVNTSPRMEHGRSGTTAGVYWIPALRSQGLAWPE